MTLCLRQIGILQTLRITVLNIATVDARGMIIPTPVETLEADIVSIRMQTSCSPRFFTA